MIIQGPNLIKNPIISVILCAYNRETTISDTINSILKQECNYPFELIIGEDCGYDKTREICITFQKKYPELIKLVLHKENCGVGKNWAILIKESRGKYIASCDDDDYWHNLEKLQLQTNYMEKNQDYGVVHTEYDLLNIKTKRTIKSYYKTKKIRIPEGYIMHKIFTGHAPICVSTSFFRKKLVDNFVPLEDYINLRFTTQDWPTWMILSKYSKIGYIPISTTTYRTGHLALTNLGSYQKIEQKLSTDQAMYKYICDMFPHDLKYDEQDYNDYKYNILLNLAYSKNDYNSAKKYASLMSIEEHKKVRVRVTNNIILFKLYAIIKKLKKHFSD